MSQAAKQMDGLSLHYYTLPTGNWDKKGSATEFSEKEWHATLVRTLRMDEFIQKHSAIMDKYDPQKRVGLMVDEWGLGTTKSRDAISVRSISRTRCEMRSLPVST